MISKSRTPRTLPSKASYFTELAFIYIYLDHMQYSKVSMILKTFLQRHENYFATLCRNIEYIFKTIGWENIVIQNSFENTCMEMKCRKVGIEVEKW